jgi:hypothetical protein
VAVGVALSTPRAKDMPRAALGVEVATPTATFRRVLKGQAGLAGPYADGPDFWPSAYSLALGIASHSCSGSNHVASATS